MLTTSPHHPFITVYVGTCHLPLALIVSWMQALPASGGGKQGYGYTPQIKDACGNRAAVCYDGVLHYFIGDTLAITLGSLDQWLGEDEVGIMVRGPSPTCQATSLYWEAGVSVWCLW